MQRWDTSMKIETLNGQGATEMRDVHDIHDTSDALDKSAVNARPITLLLAEDHALVREGTRRVLEAEPDLRVVAEAGDGATA